MTEHRSINALAESFFATYKLELIESATWPTRARARTATVHWLEAIYNRRRRHSAIDMLSPVDYEERYWDRRAAAQRRCLPGRGKTNSTAMAPEAHSGHHQRPTRRARR